MAMCTLRGWALSAALALAGVVGVMGSAAAQSLVVPLWEEAQPGSSRMPRELPRMPVRSSNAS